MNHASRAHARPAAARRPPVLRGAHDGERHATWLEVFFDLCFVAAVAALTQELRAHPSVEGLLRFAGLFVPVWWAWTGYSWYATGFDNDDDVYRSAMLAAMLAVIALSVGIGGVASGRIAGFVLPYAFMQGLLALLFLRSRRHARHERAFTTVYALGDALGAALWLASLWVPPALRVPTWTAAMLVLMTTPMVAARAMPIETFDASHIAERYGQFTLIVLGESIVAVAAGTAATGWNAGALVTAAMGFGLAACVWWVYFEFVEASALARGNLVRAFVWGYGHLLIFAGIAAAAAGVLLAVMAAAGGRAIGAAAGAILAGGMIAELAAIALIRLTVRGGDASVAARVAAALAAALLAGLGGGFEAPAFVGLLFAIVAAEALFEIVRARRSAVA
ncbi:MAG: low temperature requirement protein A [Candidatus Eisenbacteria bacterium]|uniref:Low temperature requirement protein A n=1 Tax=Eiseniibacteriota bacterium TaxID=2212470 RepID=A0A9D6L716_UNCEI|nr:low temperature requirement protein A [Candidatus Eisenbacteria bacterium]MBI3538800.1 low temperature requirement protein A [Candidatus Eisenbacteria bacterium]